MPAPLRLLLLSDTHVGFDLPLRTRVERRRRGHDFLACYERALEPALRGEVDLVVHGGDVLDRPHVPAAFVDLALAPLRRVAETGVPVFVVPGNHERSRLPLPLLAHHPRLFVFDRPRSFVWRTPAATVVLAGFPYAREVRFRFRDLLEATGWRETCSSAPGEPPPVRLLCMHHAVEGAQVGIHDFTFTTGSDVVRCADLPAGFAAVLSGHIHRAQRLDTDLAGRPLPTPVLYSGSVERTSFVEREEEKGYLLLELAPSAPATGGVVAAHRRVPLPTRPMAQLELDASTADATRLVATLRVRLAALPPDAVVRLAPTGPIHPAAALALSAAALRRLAPPTMNVDLAWSRDA